MSPLDRIVCSKHKAFRLYADAKRALEEMANTYHYFYDEATIYLERKKDRWDSLRPA